MRSVVLTLCVALASSEFVPGEEDRAWYESHMEKLSAWSIEACTHILSERYKKPPSQEPCASFVNDHGAEIMEARATKMDDEAEKVKGAKDLCGEVARIAGQMSDDEVQHLPTKIPFEKFCRTRFGLDSDENDWLGFMKNYFVLGKPAELEGHKQEL